MSCCSLVSLNHGNGWNAFGKLGNNKTKILSIQVDTKFYFII